MEDMAQDFGWSLDDDFWEEEILTPEEQAASDLAQARLRQEEAIGELYASRYAFDWQNQSDVIGPPFCWKKSLRRPQKMPLK